MHAGNAGNVVKRLVEILKLRRLDDEADVEFARDRQAGADFRKGFQTLERLSHLLLLDREGICASSGSACTTGSIEPSHVLQAMGVPLSRSKGSLRFSLGLDNTEADVDWVLKKLPTIVSRLRDTSPEKLGQGEEQLIKAS